VYGTGRARANHDRRFAGRDRGPVACAWRVSSECHSSGRTPKRRAKRVEELAGKRDLRHQNQRLLAAADHLPIASNRLRFARTGDAIEQGDVKTAIGANARIASTAVRC